MVSTWSDDQLPHAVSVRPLAEPELAALEEAMRTAHPDVHRNRLSAQREGTATYLIAWLDERPVGHGLLRWTGTTDEALRSRVAYLPSHAYVEGMGVLSEQQSRGVGSRILEEMHRLAAERGYRRIGLAVGIDNVRARQLYGRHGYRDASIGQFPISWSYIAPDGREGIEGETCLYLVKRLAATR